MHKRTEEQELIDLGPSHYTLEEYEDCLNQLERVGHLLGGDKATLKAFNNLTYPISSICDFGCGGGAFTIRLAQKYPQAKVTGIDISQEAISYAKKQAVNQKIKNIQWIKPDTPNFSEYSENFDVITSSLVCHHLDDNTLVSFLKAANKKAKKAIILNDLHRSHLAYLGYKIIAPIVFRNRLTVHDGLISIKKGFKKNEWIDYLKAAEIPIEKCSITWHWAFRWIIKIDTYGN